MRYGVTVPNIGDLDTLISLGVEAERAGWDGFFLWDHMAFMAGAAVPVHDPWVALAAVTSRTTRIRIGPMVTPVARRRPWKLARETVTLDHLSGGRLVLGVGLGFPPDADFEDLGEDPDAAMRARKLDEGLEVLTRCWSGEPFSYEGSVYRIRRASFLPRPIQRPRIPIWVAGMWPNRGPFRRAARWDGVFPIAVRDGEAQPLRPDELRDVLAAIRHHGQVAQSYEVVALDAGGAPGDFERAGATWLLDSDEGGPGWEDRTLERVRAGPSRP